MPEIETARRVIDPTDCDILGHMNVSRYFVFASDGGFGLQQAFGIDRSDMTEGRQLSFAVVHADSIFNAEVLAGDIVYQLSSVKKIGNRSAVFRHRLIRTDDDQQVFRTDFKTVLMDLKSRKAVKISEDLRAHMNRFLVEGP